MFIKGFNKVAGPNMSLGAKGGADFAAGMAGANQPSAWQNVKNAFGFGASNSATAVKPPMPPKPPGRV